MKIQANSRGTTLIAGLVAAAAFLALLGLAYRGDPLRVTGLARAIDGDSLTIDGREIRLRGIDAPELDQTCQIAGREEPCGRNARAELARLLSAGIVTCIVDGQDRFGRALALCSVAGQLVNAKMVEHGYAVAFGAFHDEEAKARAQKRGIWAGAFLPPGEWRRRNPRGGL